MTELFSFDSKLREQSAILCGIDEAGRGPLAGPVYAAAVILPPDFFVDGLNDSKKLSSKKRDRLFDIICENAVSYSITSASVEEIDELNILNASMLAMRRAYDSLCAAPDLTIIDGNSIRYFTDVCASPVIGGDRKSACIAAASILAKTARDRYMTQLSKEFPQYRFESHKGYPTPLHRNLIIEHGPCPHHRKTFAVKPVKATSELPRSAQTGQRGEQLACDYLRQLGYEIFGRNYHTQYGEIDIIAGMSGYVAFVEVKSRKSGKFASAAEAVDFHKRQRVLRSSQIWLEECPTTLQPRFDVIEVYTDKTGKHSLNHIISAFDLIETGDF